MTLARQPLHVCIDPSPYHHSSNAVSPDSSSSSWSGVLPESSIRAGNSTTTPDSAESMYITCSALCLYDFFSNDPDQLPFNKNEILDVVRQEDNGWWAAMRHNGDKVGWIPMAFVQVLSPQMAVKLRSVREELRIFEYQAEQLYKNAPVSHLVSVFDNPSPVDRPSKV